MVSVSLVTVVFSLAFILDLRAVVDRQKSCEIGQWWPTLETQNGPNIVTLSDVDQELASIECSTHLLGAASRAFGSHAGVTLILGGCLGIHCAFMLYQFGIDSCQIQVSVGKTT